MKKGELLVALFLLATTFYGCQRGPQVSIPPTASGMEVVSSGALWPLRYDGGKVLVHSEALGRPLLLVNDSEGHLRAYDSWCTHNACSITVSESGKLFCSCHSTTFEDDGTPEKKDGELTRALVEYSVMTAGDSIMIDLSNRTVRDQEGNLLEDPAEAG